MKWSAFNLNGAGGDGGRLPVEKVDRDLPKIQLA
jgi:hypothetical protein